MTALQSNSNWADRRNRSWRTWEGLTHSWVADARILHTGEARMNDSHFVPHWQLDGSGSIGRVGVLTPDFDPVPESEMWAMTPRGVSIHASRVPWNRNTRSFAEPPHVDTAVELLAGLTPDVIVYAFTGSSYVLGAQGDDALRTRLEKRASGIPIVLTAPAAS